VNFIITNEVVNSFDYHIPYTVKFSLCLIKHHTVKMDGGVKYSFMNS